MNTNTNTADRTVNSSRLSPAQKAWLTRKAQNVATTVKTTVSPKVLRIAPVKDCFDNSTPRLDAPKGSLFCFGWNGYAWVNRGLVKVNEVAFYKKHVRSMGDRAVAFLPFCIKGSNFINHPKVVKFCIGGITQ
jgi:hypothetical protein